MNKSFIVIALLASTTLLMPGSAKAEDIGEAQARVYHQKQEQCATLPKFAERAAPIGSTTGDSEKDTYAYPVVSMDSVCPASVKASPGQPDLRPAPQMDASRRQ